MTDTNGAKLLLSVKDASELLDIGTGLVYEMVRRGELPHMKLGRLVKIPRAGLENWIAKESGIANGALEHSEPQSIAEAEA